MSLTQKTEAVLEKEVPAVKMRECVSRKIYHHCTLSTFVHFCPLLSTFFHFCSLCPRFCVSRSSLTVLTQFFRTTKKFNKYCLCWRVSCRVWRRKSLPSKIFWQLSNYFFLRKKNTGTNFCSLTNVVPTMVRLFSTIYCRMPKVDCLGKRLMVCW
jgi:hypothetical protein